MGLKHLIALLILAAIYGALWWFKTGRWGGRDTYYKNKLGLREGEQIAAMWAGLLRHRLSIRPTGVTLTVTNTSRLLLDFDDISSEPMAFHSGQVAVHLDAETGDYGKLAGIHGLERTVVMQLSPAEGNPIRLEVARSVFEAVEAWARGARPEIHPVTESQST